ncbi:MAG: hypothetical protein HY518_03450 [Candidatus Aenigmarchaeota archaeon]|nr:hypothetical protein [Candidatus Aenigmarchaeota archaeon]
METKELLKMLEGIQTIGSIMDMLKANRQRAIYVIYRLRKAGYVRTVKTHAQQRVYHISFENSQPGTGYYDIINRNSPVRIVAPNVYKIYGREVSLEETVIFAIKTGSLRTVLASLSLFKKISDWPLLYRLAKENHAERKAGALYELSRKILRTRRMDGRIKRLMLPGSGDKYQYIIDGLRTSEKEFKGIERKWKVYIPFNRSDLEGLWGKGQPAGIAC